MTDTFDQQSVPGQGGSPRVVVGVDGSPDSIAALRAGEWAAAARGGTLVAVTAWGVPMVVPRAPAIIPDLRDAAAALLREALVDAFHGRCVVPIETVVQSGRAAAVLVERSHDADLVVVGSRGHGGFAGLLLGSVSMSVAMHAACPVLVLHQGAELAPQAGREAGGTVVVGAGGSAVSADVLRVAARAAIELDAALEVVLAWQDTSMYTDTFVDLRPELAEAAQQDLDAVIATAFPEGRPPRLRGVLKEGPAARVLVEKSEHADLVVVGRSGGSEFAGVLLGSVALPVAEHGRSPVLVVPAGARQYPQRRSEALAAAEV